MQNQFNYNNQLDDIMTLVNSQNTILNVSNKIEKKLPPLRQRVKENSRLLPQRAIDIMTEWYDKHYEHPYPTYREFELLAERGSITVNQVKQWFVNVRRRTQNQFRKKRDVEKVKSKQIPVNFTISELSQPTTPFQDTKFQCDIQNDIQIQIRNYQNSLTDQSSGNNSYKIQTTKQLEDSNYNSNINSTIEQFNDSYSSNLNSNESISYESNCSTESSSVTSTQNNQYPANYNYYGYYPLYYNNYYNQSTNSTSYSSYQSISPSNKSANYSSVYESSPSYNYTNYNSQVETKCEPVCSTPVISNSHNNATSSYYTNYYNVSNSYLNPNLSQTY